MLSAGERPSIGLIAADLDGTLLDSEKRLPATLPALLAELHAREIRFVPASGRQYYNLLSLFGDESMTYIAENGALVFENGRCIFADELSAASIRRALALIRTLPGVYPVLCGVESAWCEEDEPVFRANAALYYARLRQVDSFDEVNDRICKIAVFEKGRAERGCLPVLRRLSDTLAVVLSGADWVDLMDPGVSKGRALTKLREALGLSADQCMAFGDYLNDRELLSAVSHSFAMANAHPEIRTLCRYTAPSNDEDGVVRAVRAFCGL